MPRVLNSCTVSWRIVDVRKHLEKAKVDCSGKNFDKLSALRKFHMCKLQYLFAEFMRDNGYSGRVVTCLGTITIDDKGALMRKLRYDYRELSEGDDNGHTLREAKATKSVSEHRFKRRRTGERTPPRSEG